jgi:hypothetical protein
MTHGSPGPLYDRLVDLAGTPDDNALVATDLIIIAQLAANRITAADFAPITRRPGGVSR